MTAAQRNAIASSARTLVSKVQSGDVNALRADTIPAVAANFGGIAASAATLKPLIAQATITVDGLYLLDSTGQAAGAGQTSFFCGEPLVVLNFNNFPAGKYALVILHATGVPKPQQISLILNESSPGRWMLAGFFRNAMTEAGHSGLWYWEQARAYSQKNMPLNAWLYYQAAAVLLQPAPFLSSPNLGKLRHEADQARPANAPGANPMAVPGTGSTFQVTSLGTTTEFGGLELEVGYTPDANQAAQLRNPVAARAQAIDLMQALLRQHPELREAFDGIWVRAEQGNASIYALELPMKQIPGSTPKAQAAQPGNSPAM
jgi:hypothetical protein